MTHPKTIKTQCGIDKYHLLRKKKGALSRVRFAWFVFAATLVDLFKSKST